MKNFKLLVAAAIFTFASCVEDLGRLDADSGLIVIDARVSTADTIQFVFVSHGKYDNRCVYGLFDTLYFDSVKTELVTLTDDLGRVDTFSIHNKGVVCMLRKRDIEVGRTYTLDVHAEGRHFSSTQTVVAMPDDADIKFYPTTAKEGYNYVFDPIIYWSDPRPAEDDYYIFSSNDPLSRVVSVERFPKYMPITDKGLNAKIDGLKINNGLGSGTLPNSNWHDLYYGDYYYYCFYTVSKEVYDYFIALEKQLTSDGGIYQPSPSSPISNFQGENVQGLFVATDAKAFVGNVGVDAPVIWERQ